MGDYCERCGGYLGECHMCGSSGPLFPYCGDCGKSLRSDLIQRVTCRCKDVKQDGWRVK